MKKKITAFSLITFLALAAFLSASEGDSTVWKESLTAYEKGDYVSAGNGFEKLIRQGVESADLYFNLGNVYYRQGQRGRAILWYERAKQLSPRDSDIIFNLKIARSHIKNSGESFFQKIGGAFNPNELGWAVLFFSWIFFIALGLRFLGRLNGETWPFVTLWMSGLLLALSAGWLTWAQWNQNQPSAVIVSPPGEVRNGPGIEYAVGFTVPEGSRVLILNKRPDWSQVGVPQEGLKGWMPTKDIEEIGAVNQKIAPDELG